MHVWLLVNPICIHKYFLRNRLMNVVLNKYDYLPVHINAGLYPSSYVVSYVHQWLSAFIN